jgi:hypothetical protein
MCPVPVKPAVLQWYGYAAAGGGFHCLEMDETVLVASVAEQENAATVIINDVDPRSKLSVQLLSDDLKRLVDANWDWQVKRTSVIYKRCTRHNCIKYHIIKSLHGIRFVPFLGHGFSTHPAAAAASWLLRRQGSSPGC